MLSRQETGSKTGSIHKVLSHSFIKISIRWLIYPIQAPIHKCRQKVAPVLDLTKRGETFIIVCMKIWCYGYYTLVVLYPIYPILQQVSILWRFHFLLLKSNIFKKDSYKIVPSQKWHGLSQSSFFPDATLHFADTLYCTRTGSMIVSVIHPSSLI